MQALESHTMRGQAIKCTGTLVKWEPKRGYGLISDPVRLRVYFAHYREFVVECACGSYVYHFRHCVIRQGMEVEFTITPGVEHDGHYAPANEIRIKERH